jgi:hypothetical protein
MRFVPPSAGEEFYLRVLLSHVPGPTCWDDLRTVNGQVLTTYKEACVARGLIDDDREWDTCLAEAVSFGTPQCLRHLFATILMFGPPADPGALWRKHANSLTDAQGSVLKSALPR